MENLLKSHPEVEILGTFNSTQGLADKLEHLKPDVVFTDIQMPGETGLEFIKKQFPMPYAVVFTTAYADYAAEAFEFEALDYLVKPIAPDRLNKALKRIEEYIALKAGNAEVAEVKGNSQSAIIAWLTDKLSGIRVDNEMDLERAINEQIKQIGVDSASLYHLYKKSIVKGLKSAFFVNIENFNVEPKNYTKCNFNIPKQVADWERDSKFSKSLILRGQSCAGKTSLAISMFKNPLLISSIETLKKLRSDHDGLIFDDFCFKSLMDEEKIHLLDLEQTRVLPVKFGSVEIKRFLPRIFTTNKDLNSFLVIMNEIPEQIKRRIIDCCIVEDMRIKKLDPTDD
jgi:CheY-like chemotaxis protein